ncbi:hypothetical protein HDU83_007454 [Entophlyctis luteolus]|nr:hypothetical protein HDU83_007454 [Entophlyctis luteolus]KAJ3381105.1 hypothetical protein HDU84_005373 [Entophlyctis sp. JEL0112]
MKRFSRVPASAAAPTDDDDPAAAATAVSIRLDPIRLDTPLLALDPRDSLEAKTEKLPMRCLRTAAVVLIIIAWSAAVFVLGMAVPDSSALHPLASGRTRSSNAGDLALDHLVLFGDSLVQRSVGTSGFASILQQEYVSKMDILVRGFSEFNTRDALELVKPTIKSVFPVSPKAKIALVVILLGSTDAMVEDPSRPSGHVPVDEYRQNLISILETIHDLSRLTRLLLIAPPFTMTPPSDNSHSNTRVNLYREICLQLPNRVKGEWASNFTVLDSWEALYGAPIPASFAPESLGSAFADIFDPDKLHLSHKGNELLGKAISSKIRQEWPDLAASAITGPYPLAQWLQQSQ